MLLPIAITAGVALLIFRTANRHPVSTPALAPALPTPSQPGVPSSTLSVSTPSVSTATPSVSTATTTTPQPRMRPGDPMDALVQYNVAQVNRYRSQVGSPPVTLDANVSSFARAGSLQLSQDHAPHAHFIQNWQRSGVFPGGAAENQGDPSGIRALDRDMLANGQKQIDQTLALMFGEGPGGGHYRNMTSASYRRIGVGLVYAGDRLYFTNDFSS